MKNSRKVENLSKTIKRKSFQFYYRLIMILEKCRHFFFSTVIPCLSFQGHLLAIWAQHEIPTRGLTANNRTKSASSRNSSGPYALRGLS